MTTGSALVTQLPVQGKVTVLHNQAPHGAVGQGRQSGSHQQKHLHSRPAIVASPPLLVSQPNQATHSETSLAVLQADGLDEVVTAFNSTDFSPAHLTGFSRSADGGLTFQPSLTPLPSGRFGDAGDPALLADNLRHQIDLVALPSERLNALSFWHLQRSIHGAAFVGNINAAPGLPSTDQVDKPAVVCDNGTAPGGGEGNIYVVYADYPPTGGYPVLDLNRSFDGGQTWQNPVTLPASPTAQGAAVVVGKNHEVYVLWHEAGALTMAVSHDQGTTFCKPTRVVNLRNQDADGDIGVIGGARSNAFPSVAVNPVTGDLYVAWDDFSNKKGHMASVYLSTLKYGSHRWTQPQLVSVVARHAIQWEPAIAVTPDGRQLGITWYHQDTQTGLIDRCGRIAKILPGGFSLTNPLRLTTSPFPVYMDPNLAPGYMGDYDATAGLSLDATTGGGRAREGFLTTFSANYPTPGVYSVRFWLA
jgi:hypothetical protein